jgi:hypothetical protein
VFIAKTLLERTGATLTFANRGSEAGKAADGAAEGAVIAIRWRRADIETA